MNIHVHIDQAETNPPAIPRSVSSINCQSVESILAYFLVFVDHLFHRNMAASAFRVFFKYQPFAHGFIVMTDKMCEVISLLLPNEAFNVFGATQTQYVIIR